MKYLGSAPIVAPPYKGPVDCGHGFIDRRGRCVMCGEKIEADPCTCPMADVAAQAGVIALVYLLIEAKLSR